MMFLHVYSEKPICMHIHEVYTCTHIHIMFKYVEIYLFILYLESSPHSLSLSAANENQYTIVS